MRNCCQCGRPLAASYSPGFCPTCLLSGAEPFADSGSAWGAESVSFCSDFAERYEFLEDGPISRGGQGEVFKVWDRCLRREVALKRLNDGASSPLARSRFLAEAQLASQLGHPGILPIFDVGLDLDGRLFLTTALLSGRTLGDMFRDLRDGGIRGRGALPRGRLLEMLRQVCNVVAFAHDRGVVHRDLKPSNVLVGDHESVFVIDWGSAALLPGSTAPTLAATDLAASARVATDRAEALADGSGFDLATGQATLPVTLVFAPPELVKGDVSSLGAQADIYAVGVMLYELCTGRLPYSHPDGRLPAREELERLIRVGPPAPVRKVNRAAPPDVAAICEKAMARAPGDRYTRMDEVAEDIRAHLETRVVLARRPGPWGRFCKWALRNSRYLAVTSLVLAVLVGLGSYAYSFKLQSDHARQLNHLRDAQISARNGQWPAVVGHLEAAEQAGYTNIVDLAFQRIEAWTVLGRPDLVQPQLRLLQQLPDLGRYRGAFLLRLADQELLDESTSAVGLRHAREALAVGLGRAEEAYARGLLAETTTEALDLFHQVLLYDPYHSGAHRHSLSLEFALGRVTDLQSHLAVFKPFFPDDPSPVFVQAIELAMDGRLKEGERLLEATRPQIDERSYGLLDASLRLAADGAALFDPESWLAGDKTGFPQISGFLTNVAFFVSGSVATPHATNQIKVRLPQLPCMRNGLDRGVRGLVALALSPAAFIKLPLDQVRGAAKTSSEGLLLLAGGMLLEWHRPTDPKRLREHLRVEVNLFQAAAALPSVLPGAPRFARCLAAIRQLDLASRLDPPDAQAREDCLRNVRVLVRDTRSGPQLLRRCFGMALELNDLDLSREALADWEHRAPISEAALRGRIQLEIASGAYGRALELLRGTLPMDTPAAWTAARRSEAERGIRLLSESLGILPPAEAQ